MKLKLMLVLWVGLFLGCLLGFFLGTSSTASVPRTAAPIPTIVVPTLISVPTPTTEARYSLVAVGVEDPVTNFSRIYTPEPNKKVVAVEIIIGNLSAPPLFVQPYYAKLIDSEGVVYMMDLSGRAKYIDSVTQ